ncbi:hypothetical protein E2C01_015078 [Portunus trituberculatus]|uniref:Uncharacterized protein n=1 Tax=Portunus trituberculatus TaxID=210409 RepID=A0A5B7DKD8_PORTR|nr:hypothetical protein [Portunus trituberculatus]
MNKDGGGGGGGGGVDDDDVLRMRTGYQIDPQSLSAYNGRGSDIVAVCWQNNRGALREALPALPCPALRRLATLLPGTLATVVKPHTLEDTLLPFSSIPRAPQRRDGSCYSDSDNDTFSCLFCRRGSLRARTCRGGATLVLFVTEFIHSSQYRPVPSLFHVASSADNILTGENLVTTEYTWAASPDNETDSGGGRSSEEKNVSVKNW